MSGIYTEYNQKLQSVYDISATIRCILGVGSRRPQKTYRNIKTGNKPQTVCPFWGSGQSRLFSSNKSFFYYDVGVLSHWS